MGESNAVSTVCHVNILNRVEWKGEGRGRERRGEGEGKGREGERRGGEGRGGEGKGGGRGEMERSSRLYRLEG